MTNTPTENADFLNTPPDFDFSNPTIVHDCALLIEGRKFYVHSGMLSIWSEYFKGQFSAEFNRSNTDDIEIEEVTASDFEQFLLFIYPTQVRITEHNVIALFKMAHRFLVPKIMIECKRFLNENFEKVDILRLLEIAIQFEMPELKRKIGCFIFSSPVTLQGTRCKECGFNYTDGTYCNHQQTNSTPIAANSLIHNNIERVALLSSEAQSYILQALVGKY